MKWRWEDRKLRNADGAGDVVAEATDNALTVGRHKFLLESEPGQRFCLRGTPGDGDMFYIRQAGFTNARLQARCENRVYRAERINPLRRARRILSEDGEEILRTEPLHGLPGALSVELLDKKAAIPLVDVAFLTWACGLTDAPGKRVRI